MEERHTYQLDLSWTEGRIGEMSSADLNEKVKVATPPEFPNGVARIWSPEHLYTASVLSCFMTTFLAIADYSKLNYTAFDCKAEGVLEKVEGKYLMTEIFLRPKLVLGDESHRDKANRLMEKAEAACLISNSIRSKVHLELPVLA